MKDIVHLNVAHFAAAVERAGQPSLRRRPLIIAHPVPRRIPGRGRPGQRCFVYDVSEDAWREGVSRGMPLVHARRLLPAAAVIPGRPVVYEHAGRALYRLAGEFSPLVEFGARGHLFLDITGTRSLYGPPVDLAARLKHECRTRLGFDPGVGLSGSKLVSKVATRVVKPCGFVSVAGGGEALFLRPQPVTLLPGVGLRLSRRMARLGIQTLGDLAALSDDLARLAFGRFGVRFRDHARGIDNTPVRGGTEAEVPVAALRELPADSCDLEELNMYLYDLVGQVGFELRRRNLAARRMSVKIGYIDAVAAKRRLTLRDGICTDGDLFRVGRSLLEGLFTRRVRVRKVGVKLSRLQPASRQLELFTPSVGAAELQRAVDTVKRRFGRSAIVPACILPYRFAAGPTTEGAGK